MLWRRDEGCRFRWGQCSSRLWSKADLRDGPWGFGRICCKATGSMSCLHAPPQCEYRVRCCFRPWWT
jgi:hypothetical protein